MASGRAMARLRRHRGDRAARRSSSPQGCEHHRNRCLESLPRSSVLLRQCLICSRILPQPDRVIAAVLDRIARRDHAPMRRVGRSWVTGAASAAAHYRVGRPGGAGRRRSRRPTEIDRRRSAPSQPYRRCPAGERRSLRSGLAGGMAGIADGLSLGFHGDGAGAAPRPLSPRWPRRAIRSASLAACLGLHARSGRRFARPRAAARRRPARASRAALMAWRSAIRWATAGSSARAVPEFLDLGLPGTGGRGQAVGKAPGS
jgi:hypothetical protein